MLIIRDLINKWVNTVSDRIADGEVDIHDNRQLRSIVDSIVSKEVKEVDEFRDDNNSESLVADMFTAMKEICDCCEPVEGLALFSSGSDGNCPFDAIVEVAIAALSDEVYRRVRNKYID